MQMTITKDKIEHIHKNYNMKRQLIEWTFKNTRIALWNNVAAIAVSKFVRRVTSRWYCLSRTCGRTTSSRVFAPSRQISAALHRLVLQQSSTSVTVGRPEILTYRVTKHSPTGRARSVNASRAATAIHLVVCGSRSTPTRVMDICRCRRLCAKTLFFSRREKNTAESTADAGGQCLVAAPPSANFRTGSACDTHPLNTNSPHLLKDNVEWMCWRHSSLKLVNCSTGRCDPGCFHQSCFHYSRSWI